MTPRRALLAALVLGATTAARAEPPRARSETLDEVLARELLAAIDDVSAGRAKACPRLDEALVPYWGVDPAARLEWPRVMRRKIPPAAATWRSAARTCGELAIAAPDPDGPWTVVQLLRSPALQDGAQRARATAQALDAGVLRRSVDGGLEGFGRGGGTTHWEPRTSRDPAEAAPTVTGPLDPELVRRVIRQNRGQIHTCYEQQLLRRAGLKGRAAVRFTITPAGEAAAVTLEESTVASAPLEACVLTRVATWRFPPPRGGPVVVTYPFSFEPLP